MDKEKNSKLEKMEKDIRLLKKKKPRKLLGRQRSFLRRTSQFVKPLPRCLRELIRMGYPRYLSVLQT
jgi:hypothetical protein